MSEVHAVDQEPVAIHDQQEERADEGANEPVLFAEPTEEGVEFDWPVGDRDRGPTFREMLESLNDPIPTYDELEVRSPSPPSLPSLSPFEANALVCPCRTSACSTTRIAQGCSPITA